MRPELISGREAIDPWRCLLGGRAHVPGRLLKSRDDPVHVARNIPDLARIMAVQLIATPLSDTAALLAACEWVFSAVDPHPANAGNPFDIHVLTLGDGTRCEALLDAGSLHFELSAQDLDAPAWQDALFDLGRQTGCVFWSDDAPVAVVVDPGLVDAAASALDLEADLVETVATPGNLFEALFGAPDKARAQSPELASGLLKLGWEINPQNQDRAMLRLPEGCYLELAHEEDGDWSSTPYVSLGLAMPRFAQVMEGWSPDLTGPLARKGRRRMRQDTSGFVQWSGALDFRDFPASVSTHVLGTQNKTMVLADLIQALSEISDPKTLAMRAFGGDLKDFVMPTEGLWVFLFLMAEAQCNGAEIVRVYGDLTSKGAAFGTQAKLTRDMVDAYLDFHAARLNSDPKP